jgi:hypothetical protein
VLHSVPNKTWDEVCNYHIKTVDGNGPVQHCRGCQLPLKEKGTLSVAVRGILRSLQEGEQTRHSNFAFCLNTRCIEEGFKFDRNKSHILYPAFKHRLLVTKSMLENMSPQQRDALSVFASSQNVTVQYEQ